MPQVDSTPKSLKPFVCHGVDLKWSDGEEYAVGPCPFCARPDKFSVNVETGIWRCWVCGEGTEKGNGNVYTFLRLLWEKSDAQTEGTELDVLRQERGLLHRETLVEWGVCKSVLTGIVLVPGFNAEKKITQLYRYMPGKDGKRHLMPTAGLPHALMGMQLFRKDCKEAYITEGPWDGMMLWETLGLTKVSDGEFKTTANASLSLLATSSVVAVASCTAPFDGESFGGLSVLLPFDSDHPRQNKNQPLEPAGFAGMKRAVTALSRAKEAPATISYLHWGDDGYAPDLKDGYDVSDALGAGETSAARVPLLRDLLAKFRPAPEAWLAPKQKKGSERGDMDCLYCDSWPTVINSLKKAMEVTEGLDRSLSTMLACVISTPAVGDQLWCKIIGPPSCGKSTLCEAVSLNRKYIYPKDSMTGLLSGYQVDKEGTENQSMVEKLRDKTLIIKDGDTVLSEPNLVKILSQFRAFYDRAIRSQYGNLMSTDHEGINATVILCGTSKLYKLDASELGERFVSCRVMGKIDDDLEDDILWRVVNRAERNMAIESNGSMEGQHDPDMVEFMRLTGGYVGYLRANAIELMSQVVVSDDIKHLCMKMGKYIAYLRARPSKEQNEITERELAARLVSQMMRLAKATSAVLNLRDVNDEALRRTRLVAMDTAHGRSLDLATLLFSAGELGMETTELSLRTGRSDDENRKLLRFLHQIGAVENFTRQMVKGIKSRPRWKLSNKVSALHRAVVKGEF